MINQQSNKTEVQLYLNFFLLIGDWELFCIEMQQYLAKKISKLSGRAGPYHYTYENNVFSFALVGKELKTFTEEASALVIQKVTSEQNYLMFNCAHLK